MKKMLYKKSKMNLAPFRQISISIFLLKADNESTLDFVFWIIHVHMNSLLIFETLPCVVIYLPCEAQLWSPWRTWSMLCKGCHFFRVFLKKKTGPFFIRNVGIGFIRLVGKGLQVLDGQHRQWSTFKLLCSCEWALKLYCIMLKFKLSR